MKTYKTEIYSLAFGGEGVGKVDGKVCFVRDALPGEEVLFTPVKETRDYVKGELSEILLPSPERVKPRCQYYGSCGGCQLQHLDYQKELVYKKEQVIQLINRLAGIKDFICEDTVASSDPYNYRSSITLHMDEKRKLGFFSRDAKSLVEIRSCSIADESINRELSNLGAHERRDRLVLKSDYSGKVWVSDRPGSRFFPDRYIDTEITLSPKAFSQCNRYIAEKIALTLSGWIGPAGSGAAFFDVYCGVGFFCFLLKNDFSAKIGIDSDRLAIDCAKTTLKAGALHNAKFYRGMVEKDFFKLFASAKKERNILFLDPPRQGLERPFLEEVGALGEVEKIYYLSCDAARMARDIKILVSGGKWKLKRIKVFDMFPRTKHIETLAEFERNS